MSIECPDVRHIIHLGVPEDNEYYIQKSGHTGGDGSPVLSFILKTKHATHANKGMIKIYRNNVVSCSKKFAISRHG